MSNKRQRTDTDTEAPDKPVEGGSEPNAPQAGGSIAGGTGSSVVGNIIKNPHSNDVVMKFHKRFLIYNGGFQYTTQGENFLGATGTARMRKWLVPSVNLLTSPLTIINPNVLAWFLSPIQFMQLPDFSRMESSNVKCTPMGYRLPFQTNEAAATFANSQTIVFIQTAVGLERLYNLFEGTYTIDQADLTKPTGIALDGGEPVGVDYTEILYGAGSDDVGCNVGIPRHLNKYAVFIIPPDDSYSLNLTDNTMIQNVNDCKGTPVIDLENEYVNGLLKARSNSATYASSQITYILPLGNKDTNFKGRRFLAAGTNNLKQQTNITEPVDAQQYFLYDNPIEKNFCMTRQQQHTTGAEIPVMAYIGTMPLQSNAVLASNAAFANVAVIWEIETHATVVIENFNYQGPRELRKYLNSWTPNNAVQIPLNVNMDNPQMYMDTRPVYEDSVYRDMPITPPTNDLESLTNLKNLESVDTNNRVDIYRKY